MRRRGDSETRAYLAALALIAGVLVISYIAFGHPRLGGTYELKAVVSNANQLRGGSPVRIAGVDVGQVTGIDHGPGHTSTLRMRIEDRGLPLHRDATLKIRPRLFLEGGYYVDLRAGSPSAPKLGSGGTLPLPQTAVPVQLNDVLSSLDRPARVSFTNLVGETHTALVPGGARHLRAISRELPAALKDLAWVARAAQGTREHDVSGLIAGGARVAGTLGDRRDDLAGLVTNLGITARALDQADALGRTVTALDGVLRAAPPALDGLDATMPPLTRFARELTPGLRDAPQQLHAIRTAVRGFADLTGPRRRTAVIGALNTTFQNLPDLVTLLGRLFPVVRPVTSCLGSHIVPMLQAKVPDGSLSTGQPAWQEFAHALVGFSSIAQNFDGNGYHVRYGAGLGPDGLSFANVDGIGPIVANGPKLLGSRPAWYGAGVEPAYRPDASCADQPVPSLGATTTAPAAKRRVKVAPKRIGPAALNRLLKPSRLRHAIEARR